MMRYIVRRLSWMAVVLAFTSLITFVIFFVIPPTDPAVAFAGKRPTPQLIANVKASLGLDKPVVVQYALFMRHVFLGDRYGWPGLGFSFSTRSALKPIIFGRLWITMQLAFGAALFWLLLGIPMGVLSAVRPRGVFNRVAMALALVGVSVPVFFLGPLFLYLFWFKWGIAPGSGYYSMGQYGFATWLSHMIMPWIVLALLYAAFYARMTRASLLEALGQDYIRTARAKGLSETKIVLKHGLRAGLTPLVTLLGLDLGGLLGGAIVTETVFNFQGLGDYVIKAVFSGDLYVILDVTLIGSFFIVFMNLVVDILYAYLDPKVRYA